MESPKPDLANALSNLTLQEPAISVYSNVTGKKFGHIKGIERNLVRQMTNQVLWEQTVHNLFSRDQGKEFPHIYEVGPGTQLRTMLRLTNGKAFKSSYDVDV